MAGTARNPATSPHQAEGISELTPTQSRKARGETATAHTPNPEAPTPAPKTTYLLQ